MNKWLNDNGTLLIKAEDNSLIAPRSVDIYAQKDNESFVCNGILCPPLSSLGLRFSNVAVHPQLRVSITERIEISLIVLKNGQSYCISSYNGLFNDYIIIDGVWRFTDSLVERLNIILTRNDINTDNINLAQYILLARELYKEGIPYIDDVKTSVEGTKSVEDIKKPKGLNASLYNYQIGGTNWLCFMVKHHCGCILGDEMGLGKTLQIIATMGYEKEKKASAHFLVVCPISLMVNWKREIEKFYPSLSTYIHYGAYRTGDYKVLLQYDVVIMPYSCIVSDSGLLTMIHWDLLIIDEAQNIKNPKARRTKAVKQIKCDVPIAVTGTPFENHMTDIWSIVDFVMPNYLGTLSQFENEFSDDVNSASKLEKLITPIMLRRRVNTVAKDLPERVDIPQPIIMTEKEAFLYEDCRTAQTDSLKELRDMRLDKIQKLRTFCTHPYVYDSSLENDDPITVSNKYERLCDILGEIFQSKEKAVIFTSFQRMIQLLFNDIKHRFGVFVDFIDGSVEATKRQAIVDQFTEHKGAGVIILNPKAAGAGLNITCANHVIHYNLEWNPAVEDQASARVYRRGQTKNVFVHRLYYVGTIEEIINEKIQTKRLLADTAIVGNIGTTDQEYLVKALSVSPYQQNSITYGEFQRTTI